MSLGDKGLARLSKFLAFLLVLALFLVILTTVLSQTVLSSHYLEGQLTHANAYDKLSKSISAEIVKDAYAEDPNLPLEETASITPAALKIKINTAIEQLQKYYQGKAPAPILDLRDLESQITAAGLPVPETSPLAKPITLGGGSKVQKIVSKFNLIKTLSIIAGMLLLIGLSFVCWARKKFVALPDILIWMAIPIGFIAGALFAAPNVINHVVKFDTNSGAFTDVARTLATNIAHSLGDHFMIIAIVLLVVGITARILVGRTHSKPVTK